jgi:hypothetical protein
MKTKYFIFFFIFLILIAQAMAVSLNLLGGTFSEGFESGTFTTNGWSLYSNSAVLWTVPTTNPYAGTYHAQLRQSGAGYNSYMEINISTEDYDTIQIEYYRRLVGMDASDDYAAEWWNGSTWNTLEQLGSNIENGNYVYKNYSLGIAADDNPDFKLRYWCENGATTEYCRVDNIVVSGSLLEECNPTLNVDWTISKPVICDAKTVTTGTGKIYITNTGSLKLINNANVTTTGFPTIVRASGAFPWRILIERGSQLFIQR